VGQPWQGRRDQVALDRTGAKIRTRTWIERLDMKPSDEKRDWTRAMMTSFALHHAGSWLPPPELCPQPAPLAACSGYLE
jgi:hypothetical protein